MKALIFNGALERREESTSNKMSSFLVEELETFGTQSHLFNLADSGIPIFDPNLATPPRAVQIMNHLFRDADFHIWLAPLYHGSIPGVMKNALDWLEISSKFPMPYLTDKMVGLISWADGANALQGINTMDHIAKALRAWPLPYSVPISRKDLYDINNPKQFTDFYIQKLRLLIQILTTKSIVRTL